MALILSKIHLQVKFTVTKNLSLSGNKCSIYSVSIEDEAETLLERFARENTPDYREQVKEILLRLRTIGNETGARDIYFKKKEGKPGDGIEALYDSAESKLRLYCIRNGSIALIMGGGGPKQGGAWQDYPKLTEENELLQRISNTVTKAVISRDLQWSPNGMELTGNLTLDTDDC